MGSVWDHVSNGVHHSWAKYGDREMLKMPLISSPVNYIVINLFLVGFIKILAPILVKQFHHFFQKCDFKPLMLVYNGFFFGVNGAGIPMIYFCTDYGWDMFSCLVNPSDEDLRIKATKHLAYIYLYIMLFDFGKPVINCFRSKYQVTFLKLVHFASWNIISLITICFFPAGFSLFVGGCIMFHRVFYYGYLVMTVTSAEMKPERGYMFKWKMAVKLVHISANVFISLHHLYFYNQPYGCGNKFLLLLIGGYCSMVSVALIIGWFKAWNRNRREQLKVKSK